MMTRAAAYSVSPALVQKTLFASLALLLTLMAGQQYQRLQAHAAPVVHHTTENAALGFYKAADHRFSNTALDVGNENSNSIEQAIPVQVHQKTWIF